MIFDHASADLPYGVLAPTELETGKEPELCALERCRRQHRDDDDDAIIFHACIGEQRREIWRHQPNPYVCSLRTCLGTDPPQKEGIHIPKKR